MTRRLRDRWLDCRITADEWSTRLRRMFAMPAQPWRSARGLTLSSLEPRILFSATPIDPALVAGAGVEESVMVMETEPAQEHPADEAFAERSLVEQAPSEIVIIDAHVPDIEQLLDDLNASGRSTDVYVLDADRDGVEQITEILSNRSDVSSLHIVSHAEDGRVRLGSTWLGDATLEGHAGNIASWGSSFTEDADILFYGCDLAGSRDGERLVDSIAALTGTDVAASDDDTGHGIFGGDWHLEYAAGSIESTIVFSQALQESWNHLLNVTLDNTTTSTSAEDSSGTTFSHTTAGQNRLMLVGISFGETDSTEVSSVTYNGVGLTKVGHQTYTDTSKARVEIWALVAPDVGTHNVAIDYSNDEHGGATIGVVTFESVDQLDAYGPFFSDTGDSKTPNVTVTSDTDEVVFGVVAVTNGGDLSITPGSGQTELWESHRGVANGAGGIESGSAAVETSWEYSGNKEWAAAGVSIRPANLVVTTGDDLVDGDVTSVTNLLASRGSDGQISLREAVLAANNTAGADTIYLGSGTYTLAGLVTDEDSAADGDLDILDDLTVIGLDARSTVIDATGLGERVFHIQNGSTVNIAGVSLQGGNQNAGGAILVESNSALVLTDSRVTANFSDRGGGIYVSGSAQLDRVLVDANTSTSAGGGVFFDATGTGSLTNVTLSTNAAGDGAGIWSENTITITNSTITLNQATGNTGGIVSSGTTINLSNTIVAGNISGGTAKDVAGSFISNGFNLIEVVDSATGLGGDITGVGGNLGALQNNGGPTDTHALLAGSQAIDAGTSLAAPTVDQRGDRRDANPDIGAYEQSNQARLWLSSYGNVSSSGTTGINAWENGEVFELVEGSFSSAVNLETLAGTNLNVDALHYVTQDMTLGTTHTMDVQSGDLLFSTLTDETINTLAVTSYDVILFRPDTPGDYSSGTFSLVLTGLSSTVDLKSLSLIEQDTVVGDTVLNAGDFLFTQEGAADNDIYLYRTQDVGNGTTSGTQELLISGSDLGINAAIDGLELLESNTQFGDEVVSAGELIVSVDADDNAIGTSAISVNSQDVFRLQVVKTSSVTGNSVADASLLIDGAAVGLDSASENLDALTTIANTSPTATPTSTLTVTTATDVDDGDTSSVAALVADPGADGLISLREAIAAANATDGLNTIQFDIAGSGPHVISLDPTNGGLPELTGTVIIDGTSEPDYINAPVIQIDGTALSNVSGDNYDALRLIDGSQGSTIRGLSITGFTDGGVRGDAIEVNTDFNTIVGNYIGLAPDGTTVDGVRTGIKLQNGADGNTIGGSSVSERNFISGSAYAAISINGSTTNDNRVQGNWIGLDVAGDVVASGDFGIVIWNGSYNNVIGGVNSTEGNRIAGHDTGVVITSSSANALNNSILGNEIFGNADLAIDLGNDGMTDNDSSDSDSGPNDLLNHPVMTGVSQNGPNLDVNFDLDVPAGTYRIELFENADGIGGTGLGEAQRYLGAISITHTGAGTQSFSETLVGVTVTEVNSVTATATEDLGGGVFGSTSEISGPISQIAPELTGGNDLNGIDEDALANPGTLVSDLIAGQASDVNAGDVLGIAVVSVDTTNGSWQYTLNDGTDWNSLDTVNESAARLLEANNDTRIRFTPDLNWFGTVSGGITFRAWDGTSGSHGSTADISADTITWRDEFSSASYNNNDGTATWGSSWIEGSDDGSATTGEVLISNGELRIGNQDGDFLDSEERITRAVDLSDVASAELSFDFQLLGDLESDDRARVQVSDDGGASWTTLETFSESGAVSGFRSYDISNFATAETQIRFRIGNEFYGPDEFFAVDNVQIASSTARTGGSTAFSAQLVSSDITVSPVNDAPTLTAFLDNVDTTSENTEVQISFGDLAVWGDEADVDGTVDAFVIKSITTGTLKIGSNSATATPWDAGSNNTVNATTNAYWTPNLSANGVLDAFQVVAMDDLGAESTTPIQVEVAVTSVNSAPTLAGGPFALADTDEDTPSVGTAVSAIVGSLAANDADGDTLGIAVRGSDGNGHWAFSLDSTDGVDGDWTPFGSVSSSGALLLSNSSWIRYEPDGLNGESVGITFHAWDGTTDSASSLNAPVYANPGVGGGSTAYSVGTAEATLTVADRDDLPVITGDTEGSVTEDDAATLSVSGDLDASNGDTGEEFFTAENLAGDYGSLAVSNSGGWTYTADNSQSAIQLLGQAETLLENFTVTDADGVTTATVTITIYGVNDTPVISGDLTGSVTEDDAATLSTSGDVNATGGDHGEESFNAETLTGTYGELTINALGQWNYSADNSQASIQSLGPTESLEDVFTITNADDVTTSRVTITINGVNDSPVISGDVSGSVTEDQAATLIVNGDLDATGGDMGEDAFQAEALIGTYGNLNVNAQGEWTYAADNAQAAIQSLGSTDTLQDLFTITNADNVTTTTVTITIRGSNDAPTDISLNNLLVPENSDGAVIGAVSVVDPDAGDSHSWTVNDSRFEVSGGLLRLRAGESLDHEAEPTLDVSITATDGGGLRRTETFTLTVADVNEAPISSSKRFRVLSGFDLNRSAPGVLRGDVDPEGQPLTATLVTGPTNGTLTLNADGSFVYTPDADFEGVDVFTYRASDGTLTGDVTVVQVRVLPVVVLPPSGQEEPERGAESEPETESNSDDSEDSENEPQDDSYDGSDTPSSRSDDESSEESSFVPPPTTILLDSIQPAKKVQQDELLVASTSARASSGSFANDANESEEQDETTADRSPIQRILNGSDGTTGRQDHILMASPGELWHQLDEQFDQVESQIHSDLIIVGTAGAAASSFTVGVVAWALRAGFLASGFIAQMPAWRAVDPLLIMQGFAGSEDGQTLEELMESQRGSLDEE